MAGKNSTGRLKIGDAKKNRRIKSGAPKKPSQLTTAVCSKKNEKPVKK
jgi:hypothetical protein